MKEVTITSKVVSRGGATVTGGGRRTGGGAADLSGYVQAEELKNYVSIEKDEAVKGLKEFEKGLTIGGVKLAKTANGVLTMEGNLVVTGGVTMYGGSGAVSGLMDGLVTDGVNLRVVDGVLTFVGKTDGGTADSVAWENVTGRPLTLASPYALTIRDSGGAAKVTYDGSSVQSLTLTKAMVGLDKVENVALSGWTGSGKLTTVGTITSGTWQGGKIGNGYLANSAVSISGKSVSLGGSLSQADLRSALGLGSNAYTSTEYLAKSAYTAADVLAKLKTVDGSGSGLDADTLDGYDSGYYTKIRGGRSIKTSNVSPYKYVWLCRVSGPSAYTTSYSKLRIRFRYGACDIWIKVVNGGATYGSGYTTFEIRRDVMSGRELDVWFKVTTVSEGSNYADIYARCGTWCDGQWDVVERGGSSWMTVEDKTSYMDSLPSGVSEVGYSVFEKANAANKLATARKLWGQSFDGTGDVTGDARIEGNLVVTGGVTMYSDIRKKTKVGDVELTLREVADAPLIAHYYKSDEGRTLHVGSIAQYWAGLNDWFCKADGEGYLTMEVQNAALASAISVARELVRYEDETDVRIRTLTARVRELEKELNDIKKEKGN